MEQVFNGEGLQHEQEMRPGGVPGGTVIVKGDIDKACRLDSTGRC